MVKKYKDLATGELLTIDELAQKALDEGWFPEADLKGTMHYIKDRIRSLAHQRNPETGLPQLVSIVDVKENGEKVRCYKPNKSFSFKDFQDVCDYHKEQIYCHSGKRKLFRKACIEKFGQDPINQLEMDLEFNEALKESIQ
jgi:hypothetical protein